MEKSWIRKTLWAAVAMLGAAVLPERASGELTFYAPFDDNLDAAMCKGLGKATLVAQKGQPTRPFSATAPKARPSKLARAAAATIHTIAINPSRTCMMRLPMECGDLSPLWFLRATSRKRRKSPQSKGSRYLGVNFNVLK